MTDTRDLAEVSQSRFWVEGSNHVRLGEEVKVQIVLYNGRGYKVSYGGDLVSITHEL